MTKYIVTTTINPPTAALIAFSKMEEWHLIVVGDKKTPEQLYKYVNCTFYSAEQQEFEYKNLSDLIGWNTIQRRNFGFLKALELGASLIATVDDDNHPLEDWGKDLIVGKKMNLKSFVGEGRVFDPISVTNYPFLWHRGFPIQQLQSRNSIRVEEEIFVDIEASFWNGDPDIDAICRMEHSPICDFDPNFFPFTSSRPSPFNSQNTFLTRNALKSYFMFPGIGRMDDIWASYYMQAVGFRVAYSKATVRQDRNNHDLTVDFIGEIIGYTKTDSLLNDIENNPTSIRNYVGEKSYSAFQTYLEYANSNE